MTWTSDPVPVLTSNVGAMCHPQVTLHERVIVRRHMQATINPDFLGLRTGRDHQAAHLVHRPQHPSSGYRKGMQGASALPGQHVWPFTRSKSCWARCGVTGAASTRGPAGSASVTAGATGFGCGWTSMISWPTGVSVTITAVPCDRAVSRIFSSCWKSGFVRRR